MISVNASGISRCWFLSRKKLDKIARFIFKSVGIQNARVFIIFTDDSRIRRLNYFYRRKDRPTDVLAFSMREGRRLKGDASILGDIAISVDRAKEQAASFNSTFKKEICLYIIHGILHLLGYCDEKAAEKRVMQKKEAEILDKLSRL